MIIGKLIPSGTGFSENRMEKIAVMTGEHDGPEDSEEEVTLTEEDI